MTSRYGKLAACAALFCSALALNGCGALAPRAADTAAASPSAAERLLLDGFEMQARIAASDGERAANGRLVWQHQGNGDMWTVFTPLGQIAAQLTSSAASAQLRTSDGRRVDGPDAQSMLPQLLGVSAPVDALPYWVQAVPRADTRVLQYDRQQRPARISDSGWIIDYGAYSDDSATALPQRLEATKGEARLRLVIDEWTSLP